MEKADNETRLKWSKDVDFLIDRYGLDEIEKHALVSKQNNCKCNACFCCYCLSYLNNRKGIDD